MAKYEYRCDDCGCTAMYRPKQKCRKCGGRLTRLTDDKVYVEYLESLIRQIVGEPLIESLTTPGNSYRELSDDTPCLLETNYGLVRQVAELISD